MAKRSSKSESLALSYELLRRIPKSYSVTPQELHQQLLDAGIERSVRTVQRNLEMLCLQHDIICDDRSKPYGYRWDKNSKSNESLSLPSLSSSEALLLTLAQQYLNNLLPANLTSSLNGFFQEAKYQLNPITENNKEREWLKKVAVVSETQPLFPPKLDEEVFKSVSEALYHNRLLDIYYYNAKQENKSATVMPLALAQQGPRLYLVCRFHGYDNERSVAVHRIMKATVSTFSFERPEDFKLSQYDADARFGFGEGEKCQVTFCITRQAGFHLTETPLSEDQQIEEYDDHYKVTATSVKSKQLKDWLGGFGDRVWSVMLCDIDKTE